MKRYRLDPKKPPQLTPEEQVGSIRSASTIQTYRHSATSFSQKPSKLGRRRNNNSPFGWTPTFWNGSERMAAAIRPASTGFCGRQWKARPAKIKPRSPDLRPAYPKNRAAARLLKVAPPGV
jgi:hypothetical protein